MFDCFRSLSFFSKQNEHHFKITSTVISAISINIIRQLLIINLVNPLKAEILSRNIMGTARVYRENDQYHYNFTYKKEPHNGDTSIIINLSKRNPLQDIKDILHILQSWRHITKENTDFILENLRPPENETTPLFNASH